jgi:hypothetical protein
LTVDKESKTSATLQDLHEIGVYDGCCKHKYSVNESDKTPEQGLSFDQHLVTLGKECLGILVSKASKALGCKRVAASMDASHELG